MEKSDRPKVGRPSSPIPDTAESVVRALMTTPPPSSGLYQRKP